MLEPLIGGPEPALFAADFTGDAHRGYIVSTQRAANLPFAIRRVFWSFGIPEDQLKGDHAHRLDRKILVALQGQITIETETDQIKQFRLNSPFQALYVPALCWIKLRYSPGSILLALSSTDFVEQDYIYNYDEFKQLRQSTNQ
ncbi:FdtA/QdtA family cupin domain-containing protein [Adhaeribacter swui]|uniref:FdtA/QdtA family cupin domain-containing protein n=1 Tax=Adhaeribacter swui TaxID=2086471 RepID=A0A7G7GCL4_9BACT|nr:FdtA/QdtA family cupin domain-containing protein [Adhaeribacter swui]QNF34898.1 FdtA/QdtA family cupin domain-containing protein [Adhaeribacter swui]